MSSLFNMLAELTGQENSSLADAIGADESATSELSSATPPAPKALRHCRAPSSATTTEVFSTASAI